MLKRVGFIAIGLVVLLILVSFIVLRTGDFAARPSLSSANQLQLTALRGKVAIITGASGGIGTAFSIRASNMGMKLVLADKSISASQALAKKIDPTGEQVITVEGDLSIPGSRQALVDAAMRKFGRIDLVINNAGYAYASSQENINMDEAKKNFEVNFWAAVDLTRLVVPIMKKQGGGYILNISSLFGFYPVGWANSSMYPASKHALVSWSVSAAQELLPSHIIVKVACPAGVRTAFLDNMVGPEKTDASNRMRGIIENGDAPELISEVVFEQLVQEPVIILPGKAAEWVPPIVRYAIRKAPQFTAATSSAIASP